MSPSHSGQSGSGALIHGAAGTLGAAVFKLFSAHGWQCVLADDDPVALETAGAEIDSEALIHSDKSGKDSGLRIALRGVLAEAGEKLSQLDALIHIAEPVQAHDILTTYRAGPDPVESARHLGAILHAFIPWMKQTAHLPTQGRNHRPGLIHVTGMSAVLGNPSSFSQTAADAMVLALVRSAAVDLAALGLRCNTVVAVRPRATYQESWLENRTPLGRACRATEIAEAVLFLAGSGAANMTGQTMILDGGRSLLNGVMAEQSRDTS